MADDETVTESLSQVLWEDGERVFRRGWRPGDDGNQSAVLIVLPAADQPSRSSLDRLTHEYDLKDKLDGTGAVRPLDLVRDAGRTMLVLDDAGASRSIGCSVHPCRRDAFCDSPSALPRLSASSTSAVSSTRTSSRATSWSTARAARCG